MIVNITEDTTVNYPAGGYNDFAVNLQAGDQDLDPAFVAFLGSNYPQLIVDTDTTPDTDPTPDDSSGSDQANG